MSTAHNSSIIRKSNSTIDDDDDNRIFNNLLMLILGIGFIGNVYVIEPNPKRKKIILITFIIEIFIFAVIQITFSDIFGAIRTISSVILIFNVMFGASIYYIYKIWLGYYNYNTCILILISAALWLVADLYLLFAATWTINLGCVVAAVSGFLTHSAVSA